MYENSIQLFQREFTQVGNSFFKRLTLIGKRTHSIEKKEELKINWNIPLYKFEFEHQISMRSIQDHSDRVRPNILQRQDFFRCQHFVRFAIIRQILNDGSGFFHNLRKIHVCRKWFWKYLEAHFSSWTTGERIKFNKYSWIRLKY